MSARGDDPSNPELPEPGPDGADEPAETDESNETRGAADAAEADEAAGQDAHGASPAEKDTNRPPRLRRRTRLALVAAAVLVLTLVVTLVVPATRDGLLRLWCESTGGVCPAEELPPITEDEEADWRVRMEPEEAALWGNYVALGDSYSSGDGAGDYEPSTAEPGGCWRSEHAYPRVVEEEFSFAGSLGFYACSSHKGSEMLSQIGSPESQIERVTEHTSLVTVGIGGNDLGFVPVLRTCIVRMPLLESSVCSEQENDINDRMNEFEETLTDVLAEIRDRAPNARVLVLGYPRLFPEDPPGMYYTLTTSDQAWLNSVGQRFNERIRDVVYRTDGDVYGERQAGSVEFVNVYTALAGYEVSTEDSWLNEIVLGELGEGLRVDRASFHPTAQGQLSIADRVRLQIEEGPEREVYVSRETLADADEDVLTSELGGPLDPATDPDATGQEALDGP